MWHQTDPSIKNEPNSATAINRLRISGLPGTKNPKFRNSHKFSFNNVNFTRAFSFYVGIFFVRFFSQKVTTGLKTNFTKFELSTTNRSQDVKDSISP